ncbi:MAG: cytochrome c3 family protein [Phycisphaerales bacterium]
MNLRKLMLVAGAAVAMTGASANAQIAISEHNFSSYGWSGGEICKPCHTPHFAIAGVPRLWNHTLTTATYQMHEGPGTAEDNFDVASRMCLSCHDGTVALDSFGGQTGVNYIPATANLGTDLTNDHPVGSDALYPPTPQPSWWAGSFHAPNAGGSSVGSGSNRLNLKAWDDNGTNYYVVGCTTCHNAHNAGNYPHMTQTTNASSNLCLICHIK